MRHDADGITHLHSTSFKNVWNSTLMSLRRDNDRMYTECTRSRSMDSKSERTARSATSDDSLLPIDGKWRTANGRALSFGSVWTVNLYPSSDLGSLLVNSLQYETVSFAPGLYSSTWIFSSNRSLINRSVCVYSTSSWSDWQKWCRQL